MKSTGPKGKQYQPQPLHDVSARRKGNMDIHSMYVCICVCVLPKPAGLWQEAGVRAESQYIYFSGNVWNPYHLKVKKAKHNLSLLSTVPTPPQTNLIFIIDSRSILGFQWLWKEEGCRESRTSLTLRCVCFFWTDDFRTRVQTLLELQLPPYGMCLWLRFQEDRPSLSCFFLQSLCPSHRSLPGLPERPSVSLPIA